ncbi:hypothetical protein F967_02186 [Acinetobacter sp. CIP 102637]|uniref:hypothetical protein n=1 Tax=Acinetobacter sp. CIP 102637 TaxID=1144669 RepID=UPI0002CFBDCF|nr:hypothetical protein [Acinetobacter sp. CIP 102637]ENV05433.1 hypothetical protein F967_02186 [Acinetobacter sp. CIP 102637]
MRQLYLLISITLSCNAFAQLEQLDNSALQQVNAQAGADISLVLSLNHTPNYQLDTNLCGAALSADIRACRLAISLNNRKNASGYKQWLVFKGIQGTVNLQKMGLDGVDLKYKNKSGTEIVKPAIQLSFSKNTPILIRNLGFDTMAIETDTALETNSANTPGYWALTSGTSSNGQTYTDGYYDQLATSPTAVDGYDYKREIGFTGMKMQGNLSLNNKLMIFSCDGTHPRC